MPEHQEIHHLTKQSRRLSLFFGISLGALVGLVLVGLSLLRPSVEIQPDPSGAAVTINEHPYIPGTSAKIIPFVSARVEITAPGFLVYVKLLRAKPGQSIILKPSLLPIPEPKKLGEQVAGVSVEQATNTAYFFDLTIGEFKQVKLGQEPVVKPISPDRIEPFDRIVWNPAHTSAILTRTGGKKSLYDFHRYDLLHQEQTPLPGDLIPFSWDPDGTRMAAARVSPNEAALFWTNSSFTQVQQLTGLENGQLQDLEVTWGPDGDVVAVGSRQTVRLFSLETYEWIELSPLVGPKVIFSPDGKLVLGNDQNGSLVVFDRPSATAKPILEHASLQRAAFSDDEHIVAFVGGKWIATELSSGKQIELVAKEISGEKNMTVIGAGKTGTGVNLVFTLGTGLYSMSLGGFNGG